MSKANQSKWWMYPIGVGIAAVLMVWEIFALTELWDWFVSPMFGLDTPSMAAMGGLYLFWSLLSNSRKVPNVEPEPGNAMQRVAFRFIRPAVILCVGWVLA